MLGWMEYLDTPKRELTITEFMAMMLFHQRQHAGVQTEAVKQVRDALEHVEGMVGSIDEYLSSVDPRYAALSTRRGTPSLAAPAPGAAIDRRAEQEAPGG